jgi:pyruvate,water dikinase
VPHIIWFDDERSGEHALVGGKGANLGRMVSAGFPVPGGFVVTTEAYDSAAKEGDLRARITELLGAVDYADADAMATTTASIRAAILDEGLDAETADLIEAAYGELGGDAEPRVAVRSSGTAEDLADASFAGMHDTYLDIVGAAAVADAVKRCWASLWTARATTYRHNNGFDHFESSLAVVVQTMVAADTSGVMFTANPLTTNTDEIVINASWGLGEAIVSGLVTPDEYILSRRTLAPKRKTIASKSKRIVRSAESGTVTEDVAPAEAEAECLDAAATRALGALGLKVMAHYDGMPQDIEWAIEDGEAYLLQARDVTGVAFTWDEDLDASFQRDPEQNDEVLWTHQWIREFWNGAISPLHYTVRARMFEYSNELFRSLLGHEEVAKMRLFKYRRGTAYFNSKSDALHYEAILPQSLRAGTLGNLHPDTHEEFLAAPFSVPGFLRTMARMHFLEPGHGINSWLGVIYKMVEDERGPGDTAGYGHGPEFWVESGRLNGLSPEALQDLDDAELERHTEARMDMMADFNCTLWDGFFVYAPITLSALGWMLAVWCGETDAATMQTLISGLPIRTKAVEETNDLWVLVDRLRESDHLREVFEANPGAAFFAALEGDAEGEEFLAAYAAFVEVHGHRGHADRDFWFDRRSENPALDYEAFRANLLSDAARSPEAIEAGLIAKREALTEEILARLHRQPLGAVKAQAFSLALGYAHRFLRLRDDERWAADVLTMTKKQCFAEISRRLVERGQLREPDDFYFLSKSALFDLLDSGEPAGRLREAQIAGRRTAFFKVLAREDDSPLYLQGDVPLPELSAGADGAMIGTGTSSGTVTGTARVVRNLEHIGRVQKDDILICNSTDPGWASVFLIIRGLVIETGGMLAHGSCLSREYGLPAVTLGSAMRLIPDGATITVNGDTGQVTVVEEPGEDGGEAADGDAGELSEAVA